MKTSGHRKPTFRASGVSDDILKITASPVEVEVSDEVLAQFERDVEIEIVRPAKAAKVDKTEKAEPKPEKAAKAAKGDAK